MRTIGCPGFVKKRDAIDISKGDAILEKYRSNIIQLITEKTGIKVTDANIAKRISIYDPYSSEEFVFPEKGKIHFAHPGVIMWKFGWKPASVYGYYDPVNGKILLNVENCCAHTILHETLHSISNFSRIHESLPCEEFPCEGINELLTGYFLYLLENMIEGKSVARCYQSWKQLKYCFLKRSKIDVMIFYFLSTKIGIDNIIKIHIDPKVHDPFLEFTSLLNESGVEFSNIFTTGWREASLGRRKIQDELAACYGREFTSFLGKGLPEFNFPPSL